MLSPQLPLPHQNEAAPAGRSAYRDRLIELLGSNLDFHGEDQAYASHNFHAFPAKFPPQLPGKFIDALTARGDVVLDPMMGSGTTVLESFLAGRRAVGFDIDPLALRIARVKVTSLDRERVRRTGWWILQQARRAVAEDPESLQNELAAWGERDPRTWAFVQEWFEPQTQLELHALRKQVWQVDDPDIRAFFEVVFSAIIITKSGGVSLALDLAHTRPHKPKVVVDRAGKVIRGQEAIDAAVRNVAVLTKTLRSPLDEFDKRFQQNLKSIPESLPGQFRPDLRFGNAQSLPLGPSDIDLIVTSPPYASNAIDYMRAHKFSLVWLGHATEALSEKRRAYIGGEVVSPRELVELPEYATAVVEDIWARDRQKGRVLHWYYSEMTRVLREMFRVLKPGKASILVVGSSIMRGRDTETQNCLADIGRAIGFDVPKIGQRNLDRNRRMMPAGMKVDLESQIQQRMHVEYVIGFYKPEGAA